MITAGILLLSRARGFGQRLQVELVGDPNSLDRIEGPAIVHSAVLASCGVGRELSSGALVIVPGPAVRPLAASLSSGGVDGWFSIDRSGNGLHPATRQFVSLCRERNPQLRELGRHLRKALAALGCSAEPAVLELLFSTPAPPLMRLAIALRAGRAMSGGRGTSITHYLADYPETLPDPLPRAACAAGRIQGTLNDGALQEMLDRLRLNVRDPIEAWTRQLAAASPAYDDLLGNLTAVLSHLTALPPHGILAPLPPSMDAVAVGVGPAIGATSGCTDAMESLCNIFRFLGGRFTSHAKYAIEIPGSAPPTDRLDRWAWLCQSAKGAAEQADGLWRRVVDPDQ